MFGIHRAKSKFIRKESKFFLRLCLFVLVLVFLAFLSITLFFLSKKIFKNRYSLSSLYDAWNKNDYQSVYDISSEILERDYFNNAARTFYGYSAFFLAESQTDNNLTQDYLKDSIKSLRIALLYAKDELKPQIEYMLGKVYFYKGKSSNYHYYADLVIKYLLLAVNAGYKADDIAEYLGLSYASLGETQKSIEYFGQALMTRESDSLLISIAEQYYKIGNLSNAKAYFFRVCELTKNEDLTNKCHNFLGQIYIEEGDYEGAQKEFSTILEKNENSADAHYGLGVLYEKQGDLAKARAEWRRCLRIKPDHAGAVKKMSDL